MAEGLFVVGFTVEQVKAIQDRAISLLLDGKTMMEWSSGNTLSRKVMTMPIKEILDECVFALQTLAPDVYGLRVMRTRLNFNPGQSNFNL